LTKLQDGKDIGIETDENTSEPLSNSSDVTTPRSTTHFSILLDRPPKSLTDLPPHDLTID
jgi:hypothetical protein